MGCRDGLVKRDKKGQAQGQPLIKTKKSLAVLKCQAFEHFIDEWTKQETAAVVPMRFAKDNMTLTTNFNDSALLKAWIRELHKLKLNSRFHFEVDGLLLC